jgi:hypothetical protein
VPLGAATTQPYILPVTNGGYVGTVSVPAAGTSATSLTIAGSSVLPATITSVGGTNNDYPFYVVGLTATGSVAMSSPQITVQLPSNFPQNYPIDVALCIDGTCPVNNQIGVATTTSNGVVTLAAGAISGFTGVSTQQQYIVFYSSRQTPSGNSTSAPITSGQTATIQVPSITSNTGGSFSSAVTLGPLGTTTTATIGSEANGLFPAITAIVPNNETIVYALQLNANPNAAFSNGSLCGFSGCTSVVLTLPSQTVTAASGKTFYVEECSATACPVSTTSATDIVSLGTPSGSNQLTVPSTFGTDITNLDPNTAVYFVFYYQ